MICCDFKIKKNRLYQEYIIESDIITFFIKFFSYQDKKKNFLTKIILIFQ
jgi:hypothetical protein